MPSIASELAPLTISGLILSGIALYREVPKIFDNQNFQKEDKKLISVLDCQSNYGKALLCDMKLGQNSETMDLKNKFKIMESGTPRKMNGHLDFIQTDQPLNFY